MDLLSQLPSPTSISQLEAGVFLPFGIAVAVGPLWAAFAAIATSAAVWLWRASSSSPTAAKTAALASVVPAITSSPHRLSHPPALERSAETLTTNEMLPRDENYTRPTFSPVPVEEHDLGSIHRKVLWVFEIPGHDRCAPPADDEENGSEDAERITTSSWDGSDEAVSVWGGELVDLDEGGESMGLWVVEAWRQEKVMRKADLGWYAYQDREVISGNIVRLWDGGMCRRRRRLMERRWT